MAKTPKKKKVISKKAKDAAHDVYCCCTNINSAVCGLLKKGTRVTAGFNWPGQSYIEVDELSVPTTKDAKKTIGELRKLVPHLKAWLDSLEESLDILKKEGF